MKFTNLIPAIWCGLMLGEQTAVFGQPAHPGSEWTNRFDLIIMNGSAKMSWIFTHRDPAMNHSLDDDIGPATTNSIVSTNMGGLWFVLATATNTYKTKCRIECRSMLANTTTNEIHLHNLWVGGLTPDFGSLKAVDSNMKQMAHKSQPPLIPVPDMHHLEYLKRGSSGLKHTFFLDDVFDLTAPGTYRISFAGRVPSVTQPGKEVEFETPPLIITVEPQNNSTNALPSLN